MISQVLAWANIKNKPTTRDGYGITDVPKADGTGASGSWAINVTGSAGSVGGVSNPVSRDAGAQGIGTFAIGIPVSGTVASGAIIAGSSLDYCQISNNGWANIGTMAGTWRNVSLNTASYSTTTSAIFQRIS